MARHITTSVVTETLAVEGGFWCRACALPSGWISEVVMRHATGMLYLRRPWCDECGRRDTLEMSKS
jgi:hypothetical protein